VTFRLVLARAALVLTLALSVGACNSSSPAPSGHDGGAGASGAAGAAGTSGAAGAAGTSGGTAGASGTSGGTAGASGTSGGGGTGSQPIGSVCANTGNCSQADGTAICCVNMCALQAQCPMGNQFIACASQADCAAKVGSGRVCCKEGAMPTFCTKPSGCSGTTLP
jgi:hypothetical protein